MEKRTEKKLEELKYYLNISIKDEDIDKVEEDERVIKRKLFIQKLKEYLNSSLAKYQLQVKKNVEEFLAKAMLSRNFLLTSTDQNFLDMKIEDVISILKEFHDAPKEKQRNCLSLNNNPVQIDKMIFDLEKIFSSVKKKKIPVPIENNTPCFKANSVQKIVRKNQNQNPQMKVASIYKSPSPVIMHKNIKKINTNDKNEGKDEEKEKYISPEKKNFWK